MSSQSTDWRTKAPTEKQIGFAKRLGIKDVPKTAGEMSDLINKAKGGQTNNLDRVKLDIPSDQQKLIEEEAGPLTDRLIAVLLTVRGRCLKAGISEAPAIGMIFNQVCEQRRYNNSTVPQ